jgi:DNA polymerase-3 subunit gamma/tau
MSYIVLARKWRPQTFEEVVGQEHIVKTLAGAIKQNRVSHAYLFTGPRGVGKTTTARLLAKALNCEKGPSSTPCNKCTNCKEITIGNSLDILEIDAASNRGIDEIRDLREKVKFAPASCKYKVYIIDEVHMLTPEAFNALLKTLEEPPSHILFILATTAPFKLPLTILSRCQRFDFRRIRNKDIVKKLAEVVKAEGHQVSEDILFQLARASEGSMRDAMSALDQLISLGGKKVTQEDLQTTLGIVPQAIFSKLTEAIAGGNSKEALHIVSGIIEEGSDLRQFAGDLLEHFRNLLMIRISEEIVDLSQDAKESLKELAANFDQVRLLRMIEVISRAQAAIKRSEKVRLIIEMAVVKLTTLKPTVSVDEILKKIASIEERLGMTSGPDESSGEPTPGKEKSNTNKEIPKETTSPKKVKTKTSPPGLSKIKEAWGAVIKEIKKHSNWAGAFLMEAEPVALHNRTLTIGFPQSFKFHKEQIESKENKRLVEKTLGKVVGGDFLIDCSLTDTLRRIPEEPASEARTMSTKEFIQEEPIVKETLSIFGGKIAEIKPPTGRVMPPGGRRQ